MDKIITVEFADGSTTASVSGLWQYDHGITLEIKGLELETAPEIHFSYEKRTGTGIVVDGTTADGVTICKIPDSFLATASGECGIDSYTFYVWVYLDDSETGRTMAVASIEVKRRSKPDGYVATDDDAKTWASKGDTLKYEDSKLSLLSGDNVLSTVEVESGSSIEVDSSLTVEGAAADAKTVGDSLNAIGEDVTALNWEAHTHDNKDVLDGITAANVSAWDNKSDFDGKYTSLTDKPFDDVVITIDSASVDTSIPSAKAVYDYVQSVLTLDGGDTAS